MRAVSIALAAALALLGVLLLAGVPSSVTATSSSPAYKAASYW